jgi:hypothetical protein
MAGPLELCGQAHAVLKRLIEDLSARIITDVKGIV